MTIASIFFLTLIALGGAYLVLSLLCVLSFFGKSRPEKTVHLPPEDSLAVSILKPIKGFDPSMAGNLESFLAQEYPRFEVLFGFRDPEDPALPFVKRMAAEAPCEARVVVSNTGAGANDKVLSLQALADNARYSMLALSDSDMVVDRDYLSLIIGEFLRAGKTGIVTSLYKISRPVSVGSALESLTIALDFIPSVLVARRMEGITFGLGASILISKEVLRDIGGFAAIADYLADDYQLGNRCWQKGYDNVLSARVIENRVGPMSIREHLVHQLRWARTQRVSRPTGYLGYGISHLFPFTLLFFLICPGVKPAALIGLALALRYALALSLYRKVVADAAWLRWLFLIPFKDALSFLVWLWSFAGSKVYWRGAYYRTVRGGKMVKIDGGS
ncbi:MAG: glycosyltransferase [Syntrophorhabdales bacterium]